GSAFRSGVSWQGGAAADVAGWSRGDADAHGGLHERRTGQDARVSAARAGRLSPGGREGHMATVTHRGQAIPHELATTTFELPGCTIVQSLGLVRGIVVRSRSVFGNIGAGIQMFFGGNITLY